MSERQSVITCTLAHTRHAGTCRDCRAAAAERKRIIAHYRESGADGIAEAIERDFETTHARDTEEGHE